MARKYSNTFAETTLSGSISNSATTITIGSTTGLPASFPYTLALDYGLSTVEMVTVTALAGSNLTVTRGQDGTSGQAHSAGARVVHPVSARDLSEPQVHIDATSDVHGLTGGASVVGTSQAQTLTNKTISGSANTLSNIGNSSLVDIAASKVTMPFASLTVTGANGAAKAVTVTGDEVSRTTPIASFKRGSVGLLVGEDAVVQATSGLSIDFTERASGAAALTSRLYIKASAVIGAIIQRAAGQTQDLLQVLTEAGSGLFTVTQQGNVSNAGSISAGTGVSAGTSVTATTSLNGATAAVSGNATVGGTLGVTGTLTASGAVNAASAAVTGAVTTGSAGVTVAAETWHALTLAASWANFGSGFVTAQYRKVPSPANSVEIIGVIGGGTATANTTIATLPAGYRPTNTIREKIYAFGPGTLNVTDETPAVNIDSSGNIKIIGSAGATIVSFHFTIPLDA